MIVIFTGPAGQGKTFVMSRIVRKEWKKGEAIYPNFPVWFDHDASNIFKWNMLEETYHLKKGILMIDESQKLLDARNWALLPPSFRDKIAMHRHHHIDIYTTTQDLGHIDLRLRSNAHRVISCKSIYRLPKTQKEKPLFQIIRAISRERKWESQTNSVMFEKKGKNRYYFLSRLWTKTYYDTYGEVGLQKSLCKVYRKGGKWFARIYGRDLVERGKARL